MLGGRGGPKQSVAEKRSKSIRNHARIHHLGAEGVPKSIILAPSPPEIVPKHVLEASRFLDTFAGCFPDAFRQLFGAI